MTMSMHAENLFTTFRDRVRLRVVEVLDSRNVSVPASEEAKKVLRALQSRMGAGRPISRADLVQRTNQHDRVVRDVIHELRATYMIPIGIREDGGGYYLIDDEADSLRLSDKMIGQGVETIRAGAALLGPGASMTELTRRIGLALHEGRDARTERDQA